MIKLWVTERKSPVGPSSFELEVMLGSQVFQVGPTMTSLEPVLQMGVALQRAFNAEGLTPPFDQNPQ